MKAGTFFTITQQGTTSDGQAEQAVSGLISSGFTGEGDSFFLAWFRFFSPVTNKQHSCLPPAHDCLCGEAGGQVLQFSTLLNLDDQLIRDYLKP